MNYIKITIPFKTPTTNTLYYVSRGRLVKSSNGRLFAARIKKIVEDLNLECLSGKLGVIINVHEDWYCKNGKLKKEDVVNREKLIIDSIFSAFPGMDDSQIFTITLNKVQDSEEFAEVSIREISYEELAKKT